MLDHNRWASLSRTTVGTQIKILVAFVALFWAVEVLDWLIYGRELDALGIVPRTWDGLRGVVLAPLLHASFTHLAANTMPFFILGWLVMWPRTSAFFMVTAVAALVSGLGVWLIAPANSIHIGASGLVFGYLGFLLSRGYFERNLKTAALGVLVGIFYSGFIWGILPQGNGVSWQGHLFGLIGGGVAAYLWSRRRRIEEEIVL